MKKLMIMAALPVLAMAAPQAAMAETSKSAEVSYAGLDLTTEAGQKEFKSRIARAVNKVCTDSQGVRGAAEASKRAACKKSAMQQSEQQYAAAVSEARYGG
ncbi:UrcA family protein [Croceicoccus marinus]|jgi:UrcA family protein|uniref:UrcA family protein n=1 Tax=Croceicoccus marinus TaxID=450378 RepID=A0A7G6VV48_9SPHN|nr:UrcA family protein [Croceicoccus marinus]QNE05613.1 UrcA family protein [Croceicoccus marinus]